MKFRDEYGLTVFGYTTIVVFIVTMLVIGLAWSLVWLVSVDNANCARYKQAVISATQEDTKNAAELWQLYGEECN